MCVRPTTYYIHFGWLVHLWHTVNLCHKTINHIIIHCAILCGREKPWIIVHSYSHTQESTQLEWKKLTSPFKIISKQQWKSLSLRWMVEQRSNANRKTTTMAIIMLCALYENSENHHMCMMQFGWGSLHSILCEI